jgi:hypothetical protein
MSRFAHYRLGPLAVLLLCLAGPLFALPREEPSSGLRKTLTEDQRQKLLLELEKTAPEDAQKLLGGKPQHVSRQVLYHRYLEQWIYDHPFFLRIEVDFRRGQKPKILTVHSATSARP